MLDVLIKNGTIIDGTGKPMFLGDVGIKEEKIREIGQLNHERAHIEIDAKDQYVCPGFVDVNNHSDTYWRIFSDPELESLLYQGITTIIGGNCGSSLAPLVNRDIIQTIQKWTDINTVNLNWLSMGEFLKEIEKRKLAVNFGTLVGHATLRRGLLRDEVRDVDVHELKTMKEMLKRAMKEGAFGISTGLVYTHAKSATAQEITELVKVVKEYNGVYTTHVRGETHELLEAVAEAIDVAKKTGANLQISHLKAIGENNWPLMDQAVNMIETARTDNMNVNFDVYPYTHTGSVLYILLPDWVAEGGKKLMLSRLKDPETRAKVIEEMKNENFDYSKITISISPLNKTLTNRRITDIAKLQEKSVEETIIDILVASEGRVIAMIHGLSENNVIKAIRNPFSIISTNGAGYNLEHKETSELVHPRNFGSFPRVLGQYVREKDILSWEEAVNKISGRPAEKFGIKKRGSLKIGNYADVTIIDPKTIADLATYENPYQYAKGVNWVVVNGKVAMENGKFNGNRNGEVIRKEINPLFKPLF
jgi:N-acyl-D-amino-acid deacylase